MSDLRKFIATTIKEYLNEQHSVNKTKMVAYHGLSKMKAERLGYDSDITIFDTNGFYAQRIAGAYFTPFIEEAKKYAKREGDKIYKVELSFNKLADRKILDEISPVKYNGDTAREFLIGNGYDGVYDEPMKEIVVFYPEQIKILETIEI
jgi:hypothetical protein